MFLKDVRLIKDKVTNTSRGFCFVETASTEVCLAREIPFVILTN